jgi:hypothetical protein
MRNRFLMTAAFIAAPLALSAADSDKAHAATVRCRVFAVGKAPAGEVFVKNKGKYQKIEISTDYVTPSFRADAKEGIVFFRKRPPADSKDKSSKETYEPFATCAPDGSSGRQLVFLTPGSKDTWVGIAKSDVETAFPPGARLVFNLSSSTIGFDFGGTTLQLKPKQSVKMSRQTNSGAWSLFMSSVWRQSTDERNILLIYPVAGSEDVALSCIQDVVEAKDDEEKKADAKPR